MERKGKDKGIYLYSTIALLSEPSIESLSRSKPPQQLTISNVKKACQGLQYGEDLPRVRKYGTNQQL